MLVYSQATDLLRSEKYIETFKKNLRHERDIQILQKGKQFEQDERKGRCLALHDVIHHSRVYIVISQCIVT